MGTFQLETAKISLSLSSVPANSVVLRPKQTRHSVVLKLPVAPTMSIFQLETGLFWLSLSSAPSRNSWFLGRRERSVSGDPKHTATLGED